MIEQLRRGSGFRTIGWWTPQRDQVDPTIPYLPLEDPTGGSEVTGTGVLVAQVATCAGVGITASLSTDGAISAQSVVLAGAGLSASVSTDGAIFTQVSTLLSTGLSGTSGVGILVSQLSALVGTGISLSTGVGILLAAVAGLVGAGMTEDAEAVYSWRNRMHRRIMSIVKRKRR